MKTHTWILKTDNLSVLQTHIRGPDYISCLHDITQEFRSRSKYNVGEDHKCTWSDAYELLWKLLNEHKIDPFEEE